MIRTFIALIFIPTFLLNCSDSLHIRGKWHSKNFYKFLAKFGFQKTDDNDKTNTQGYIYGNITSPKNTSLSITFAVLDSEYFIEFYGNSSVNPRTQACPAMFKKIDSIAWHATCNPDGKEDFLRSIPCPKGELCLEEDTPEWVTPGYQFTYRVQDTTQPRFWFVSMVSCFHDLHNESSCFWTHNDDLNMELDFDVWLVNGHPLQKHMNPFEHQFSFEMHDIFEVYLAFFILYSFLMPIQLYAMLKQKHMLPIILTSCMSMEYVGILFNFIHVFIFAFNGSGIELLKVVGNFIDNVAECMFMLLLLLVVKGWTITRMDIDMKAKIILFTVWGTYTLGNMALFIWNLTEIDIISDIDEWQTWPGYLILAFRIAIMVWFLFEMRETFKIERSDEKHKFYLHFGAGFLVWFVYLPIVAAICIQISPLWRYKTLISVTYGADLVSYCVMVHLLWPTRSYIYFNLKTETRISLDDLEFSDTPMYKMQSDSSDDQDASENTLFISPFKSKKDTYKYTRLNNLTENGGVANGHEHHHLESVEETMETDIDNVQEGGNLNLKSENIVECEHLENVEEEIALNEQSGSLVNLLNIDSPAKSNTSS